MTTPLPIAGMIAFVLLYMVVRTITTFQVRRLARRAIEEARGFFDIATDEEHRAITKMQWGNFSSWEPFVLAATALFLPVVVVIILAIELIRWIAGYKENMFITRAAVNKQEERMLRLLGFDKANLPNWDSSHRRKLSLLIQNITFLRAPLAAAIVVVYTAILSPFLLALLLAALLIGATMGTWARVKRAMDNAARITLLNVSIRSLAGFVRQ
jgi:hypothetical protein